jgi:glutamine amidotransferase
MIAVVDSGVANLASVMAALHRLGVEAEVTADAGKIREAERVILPGVGSAAAAMAQLHAKKLVDILRALTQPVLGVCLGMQLLFAASDEGGGVAGLGILPGTAKLLNSSPGRPVPHMGWNQLDLKYPIHSLLHNIDDGSFVYFVHSYAVPANDIALATTDYGENFASVVGYKNFFGCQFHPERSGKTGSQILKNFLGL